MSGEISYLIILGGIKEVVVTMAALVGVLIAALGLRSWKQEMKGRADWELARRYLRGLYTVRDAIHALRMPFMSAGEMSAALARERDATRTADESSTATAAAEAMHAAYEMRWAPLQKAWSDLMVEKAEAEALWGSEAANVTEPLAKVVRELQANLGMYLRYKSGRWRGMKDEQVDKVERVVFGIPDDHGRDDFGDSLADAIAATEAFIRPKLKQ